MSLESKLNRIIGAGTLKPVPINRSNPTPIDQLIEGEWVEDGDARVFIREHSSTTELISVDHLLAIQTICDVSEISSSEKLLFLDTETTGLAGGTGTFAFMVGIGRIVSGKFITTQYFMPGFGDELLMLQEISKCIGDGDKLVTFNGKTFDIPLLETRYLINRLKNPLQLDHVDLLHYARVIWRDTLDSCSLQSLERNILDLHRFNDTPGYMIPQLYFDYIRHGNANPMPGIFEHNVTDIESMHRLLIRIADIMVNPNSRHFDSPVEQLRVARYHRNKGRTQSALEFLGNAIDTSDNRIRDRAHHEIAFIHKKQGDHQTAFDCFSRVCSCPELMVSARVEMAKHLEHRVRDFEGALELTREAIQTWQSIKGLGSSSKRDVISELYHRQGRLLRKLGLN